MDKTPPSKDVLVRALREIKELKEQLAAARQGRNEPIAVIGLACRFPGDADTPDDYWRLLAQGVNAIREVPHGRWDVDALYDPDPEAAGKMTTKMGGFLREVDGFDPVFFGIAPREIASMDPQHRLALEVSWEALERAGLPAEQLLDSETGVFMGVSTGDYAQLLLTQTDLEDIDAYSLTGNSANVAAGRIAYALGLQGPTVAVDTACSSALVAVHLACQSLRNRECDAALAGGVNLILSPINSIAFSRMRMLAADGLCKTFDAQADGYARGEGCGVVVLKRLADAVAAGDNVLALIRGSAINQDGRSGGLTVPNGPAQQAVMRRALRQADVEPRQVSYVEAHGTGTPLGDPIELESLGAVYSAERDKEAPLWVGSVKTNFGHLETAAGIAGLIKIILSLQQGLIPPHLHFQEPTPRVDWDKLPLQIPTELTKWRPIDGRRLAGVSSFGFSGTNAHVILEEGDKERGRQGDKETRREGDREILPLSPSPPFPLSPSLLATLSAKSEAQLREMATRMADYLGREDIPALEAICYTSQVRRSHWNWRLAAVADEGRGATDEGRTDRLRSMLTGYAAGEAVDDLVVGESRLNQPPKVTFFFSGQGGQRVGMGADLYASQPVFRRAFDQCAAAAEPYLKRPLTDHFFNGVRGEMIADAAASQVALCALQISLARLWQAWGVEPDIVLGQSLGEFAAAVIAGVFDLETAVALAAERACLMADQPVKGAMGVIFTDPADADDRLARYADRVWLAGQNGPRELVVAGYAPDVAALLAECDAAGIKTRSLRALAHTNTASHTPLMRPVMAALAPRLEAANRRRPSLDYISSYTGALADEELTTVEYWLNQSQRPFNLYTAVNNWLALGSTLAVEIGPTSGTLGVARRCAPEAAVHWLPSMREQADEQGQMATALAALYVNGVAVNWPALYGDRRYPPAPLPTTPFQRERYWLPDGKRGGEGETRRFSPSPLLPFSPSARLLGERIPSPLAAAQFTAVWDKQSLDFLGDHLVHGAVVMAGAAHLLRALTAAQAVYGEGTLYARDVLFARPLILGDEARRVQLVVQPNSASAGQFQISGTAENGMRAEWIEHVTGQVGREMAADQPLIAAAPLADLKTRCPDPLSVADFYAGLRQRSYELGPTFRWLEAIWRGEGEALAQVRLPQAADGDYLIPPGLLDGCLQLLSAAGPSDGLPTYVPYSVEHLRFYGRANGRPLWCHAALRPERGGGQTIVGDLCLFDETGERLLELVGLHARPIAPEDLRREIGAMTVAIPDNVFFEIQWRPKPIVESGQGDGRWLIFADELGVGAALAAARPGCLIVQPGDNYRQIGPDRWQIRPQEAADYGRLLIEAADISGILHMWSLNGVNDDWLAEQRWGSESVLLLLQAMAGMAVPAGTAVPAKTAVSGRLYCATMMAQPVGASEPVSPGQAALWGLGATAANEQPSLWGGLIDLPQEEPEALAAMLRQELGANDGEDRVAWRNGERFAARLAHGHGVGAAAVRFAPEAAYLVTGGLGALGLHLAEWLVERGARYLVLLGRRAPDEAAQARIGALRERGTAVMVRQVDVTDWAELTAVLAEIEPPLRGIFHLAGILEDATLLQESPTHLRRVMAAKLQGGQHLHQLTAAVGTAAAELDYFVLFSSAAAVLGGPGQAAYAAANAGLDGLAHYRRGRGLTAVTLNWGPWRGGGLAERDEGRGTKAEGRWQAWGIGAVDPAQGVDYLALALARPEAQLLIMPWDLTAVAQQATTLSPFFSELVPLEVVSEDVNEWRERIMQTPPQRRRALLVEQLREQARRTLRLPVNLVLDEERPLHELGLDSLMAVELRNALAQLTGAPLPVTLLFDYPSLGEMADYLLAELFEFAVETAVIDERPDALATEIEALSEDEALARLIASLDQIM